jgi:hypothetical protein
MNGIWGEFHCERVAQLLLLAALPPWLFSLVLLLAVDSTSFFVGFNYKKNNMSTDREKRSDVVRFRFILGPPPFYSSSCLVASIALSCKNFRIYYITGIVYIDGAN